MLQTGSATTESENAGLLHTYPWISSPELSSVSTSAVVDITDQHFFVLKAPTENDIYELFITKWTPEVDGGVSQFDVGVP